MGHHSWKVFEWLLTVEKADYQVELQVSLDINQPSYTTCGIF